MPLHFICSLRLNPGIIAQFNRIIRQCLWREDFDVPKQSLAAWDMICKPKMKGGLGIVNFTIKNDALLIKHLHQFYNRANIPWVNLVWESYYGNGSVIPHASKLCGSFWWKDIAKLRDNYRLVAKPTVVSGTLVLFWSDDWEVSGSRTPLRERFARLFSYAKDDKVSVKDMCQTEVLEDCFHLPLSTRGFDEFLQVSSWTDGIQLAADGIDEWKTSWNNGEYLPSKYYTFVHEPLSVCPVYTWIWKSKCIMRIKMFALLLLSDRLNTRDMLKQRQWKVTKDVRCELCHGRLYEDSVG
jgi:hypothetical protein